MDLAREFGQTAQTLAAGLAPPSAPSLCPFCFATFVLEIKPPEHTAVMLNTKYHSLWDAMVAFICADWTPELQAAVADRLTANSLACTVCKPAGYYHIIEKCDFPDTDTYFGMVYQYSGSAIYHALTNEINRYKGFGRKPKRWPTRVEQLFPYGPDRTVSSLVAQLDFYAFSQDVLTQMLSHHRPLVVPILMRDDMRARVIASVIFRLDACVSRVNNTLRRLPNAPIQAVRDAVFAKEYEACEGVVEILVHVIWGMDCKFGDMNRFYAGHEAALFRAVHAVALLKPKAQAGEGDPVFILARDLWYIVPPAVRHALGCIGRPAYVPEPAPCEQKGPYHTLFNNIAHPIPRRTCCAPGCEKSVHDQQRELSLCAKCRTARYCSRDCQRAHWTSAPLPHKLVCDALHELRTFADVDSPDMTPDAFAAACVAHSFPLDRVNMLLSWAQQRAMS